MLKVEVRELDDSSFHGKISDSDGFPDILNF